MVAFALATQVQAAEIPVPIGTTWGANGGAVQTSPDLATWTNVNPKPTPAGGTLCYTLPTGPRIQFVRLLVTPTP